MSFLPLRSKFKILKVMNKLYVFFLMVFSITTQAQTFQKISCGASYKFQSYVKLEEGSEKQVLNDTWDIAFTAFGTSDAGIFINESSTSSNGENIPLTELYDAKTNDFDAPIDISSVINNKTYNSEVSWNYGAFNEGRNPSDPFDYGWGKYNPQLHGVYGDKVFVLKLRNGQYKKIQVFSLAGIVYNFKYADLDGSNLVTKSINKQTENFDQNLIFYSFTTESTVDILPEGGFDMMYGRYIAWAKDPNGTTEQFYNVTGVLTGPGIKTAIAKGVNFENVEEADYTDKYSNRIDVIGYDWKNLLGTSWSIEEGRVHFLKMSDNAIWKIEFVDFEGSATGNAVFRKEKLGTTSVSQIEGVEAGIFPNPTIDNLYLTLDVTRNISSVMDVNIIDMLGKVVKSNTLNVQEGLNVFEVNTSDIKAGTYLIRINNGKQSLVQKFVKK